MVTGGLNPGGMLSDSLNMNPNSALSGFVQGATNSAAGGAIEGDLSAQDIIMAGLMQGGGNIVKDALGDAGQTSLDSLVDQNMANGMSQADAVAAALENPLLNTSDLGGLVGPGGLLSGLGADEYVGTGWISDLNTSVFGHAGGTDLFTGPNGETMTSNEVIAAGGDPGAIYGGDTTGGFSYQGVVDSQASWLDEAIASTPIGGMLDSAAASHIQNTYGFDPNDPANAALLEYHAGNGWRLDERYTFSNTGRGDGPAQTGIIEGNGPLNGYGGNVSNPFAGVGSSGSPSPGSVTSNPGNSFNFNGDGALPGVNNSVIGSVLTGVMDGFDANKGDDKSDPEVLPGAEENVQEVVQQDVTDITESIDVTEEQLPEVIEDIIATEDLTPAENNRLQSILDLLGSSASTDPEVLPGAGDPPPVFTPVPGSGNSDDLDFDDDPVGDEEVLPGAEDPPPEVVDNGGDEPAVLAALAGGLGSVGGRDRPEYTDLDWAPDQIAAMIADQRKREQQRQRRARA